jgi:ribosome-binding factor A
MRDHTEQFALRLQEAAAQYVASVSNRTSLITVTRTKLTRAGDQVTFFVTVYPESAEAPALGFLMRKRGECKAYLKEHVPARQLPHVEFALDVGDKHRRRVDELLQE